MSNRRHSRRGLRPLARQVPKRDAKVILLSVPCPDRVPPLILRLITRCCRLRSAALLSEGTTGSDPEFLDEPFHAPAELGLNRIFKERPRQDLVSPPALAGCDGLAGLGEGPRPWPPEPGEPPRPTEPAQRLLTTLSGHGYPAADTVASGPGSGYRRPLTNTPLKEESSTSSTTPLSRLRRRKYRSLLGPNIAVAPVLAPAGFVALLARLARAPLAPPSQPAGYSMDGLDVAPTLRCN